MMYLYKLEFLDYVLLVFVDKKMLKGFFFNLNVYWKEKRFFVSEFVDWVVGVFINWVGF